MIIKELLEAIEDAISGGWINQDSEVTIEFPTPENDSYHIHSEYPWNVYFMLDKTFSLTLGRKFSELEYEEPDTAFLMERLESAEMRKRFEQGIITRDEYITWLKTEISEGFDEDHG